MTVDTRRRSERTMTLEDAFDASLGLEGIYILGIILNADCKTPRSLNASHLTYSK